jgi:carboxyl-terminal processing protease
VIKKTITFFLISILLLPTSLLAQETKKVNGKDEIYKKLDLFGEALATIQHKYVEDQTAEDLIYGAISGLLLNLDPYSQFLKPDDYKDLLVETEGEFGGLGIEITIQNGLLTIVSPMEGTPAWDAGIKAGDIIVKIDGEVTKNITLHNAVKKLRGKPGTDVTLTILREDEQTIKEVTVTRDIIKIKDIKRAQILDDSVAYIRLSEFRESTAADFDKALAKLNKKGFKGIILDLRNNPGGLLASAIDIASRFLKADKLIVYTKSRQGRRVEYTASSRDKKYLDIPMVVIINEGSASGSEIVAAALRDHNRAILLGTKSFGKGSVQSVIPLSDGSAVRLTTAKYYTPKEHSIHDKGITPDITVEEKEIEETKEDIFEKIKQKRKDFNYRQDYLIVRALDLLRGLLVLSENKQ